MNQREFLELLYTPLAGSIDVRAIAPDGPIRHRIVPTLTSALDEIDLGVRAGSNVYVGVATRRDPTSGAKTNLRVSRVLWIDRDFHEEGEPEAHQIALERFPLPPSLRVSSGGGEHDYWLLEEPYRLEAEAAVARSGLTARLILAGECGNGGCVGRHDEHSRTGDERKTHQTPEAGARRVHRGSPV